MHDAARCAAAASEGEMPGKRTLYNVNSHSSFPYGLSQKQYRRDRMS